MTYKKLQIVTFLIFLFVMFILAIFIARPFLKVLAFGIIIAILFWPVYEKIYSKLKSQTIASFLTIGLILVILFIPIWIFGRLIFNEAFGFYYQYQVGQLDFNTSLLKNLPPQAQYVITQVVQQVTDTANSLTSNALQTVSGLLSNILGFFAALFLFFFTVFFILKDGEKIKKIIIDISPLATEQEYVLFKKIANAVNGVVKGAFLVALMQGSVATVGFLIFGVPQPFIWGLFTVITALVPVIGTSLSMIPAIIFLFLTGHLPAAFGLALWTLFGVSLIDNIVGPKLIGARTKLHPLLVFISVIGGIQLFGFVGFLLGPIAMAIFVALIDMYRTDFKDYLET